VTDSIATCRYCKCPRNAHTAGKGQCWTAGCECRLFTDPARMAIPARFDERYDPSPEPIVRRIS
jgi:hypothetical protein